MKPGQIIRSTAGCCSSHFASSGALAQCAFMRGCRPFRPCMAGNESNGPFARVRVAGRCRGCFAPAFIAFHCAPPGPPDRPYPRRRGSHLSVCIGRSGTCRNLPLQADEGRDARHATTFTAYRRCTGCVRLRSSIPDAGCRSIRHSPPRAGQASRYLCGTHGPHFASQVVLLCSTWKPGSA